MPPFETRRILIWGKTKPELSESYRETVCTGGVFADTKDFVRLYPIPLRYLSDEAQFRKYQWLEARVQKTTTDPRPESYIIDCDSIRTFDTIPTNRGNWDARAQWILRPDRVFDTMAAAQAAQAERGLSVALLRPTAGSVRILVSPVPPSVRADWEAKYTRITSQPEINFYPEQDLRSTPLPIPDVYFKAEFEAGGNRHECKILDWEPYALYHRMLQTQPIEAARQSVVNSLQDACAPTNDLLFFVGNTREHLVNFTIVGLWRPKRKTQASQQGQPKQGELFGDDDT